jgi:hypothetical protein
LTEFRRLYQAPPFGRYSNIDILGRLRRANKWAARGLRVVRHGRFRAAVPPQLELPDVHSTPRALLHDLQTRHCAHCGAVLNGYEDPSGWCAACYGTWEQLEREHPGIDFLA